VELRPIWKLVVRAAVAVDHQPPPLSSIDLPGPPPDFCQKKSSGIAYAGFAAVVPDMTVAAAAVTAEPDAGIEYSSSAWVPV
jgi:hypothetical protein